MPTNVLVTLSLAVIICTITSGHASSNDMQFKSSGLTISINDKGEVTSLKDNKESKEYVDSAEKSYLLRTKAFDGSPEVSNRMTAARKGDGTHLTMNFKNGVIANIVVTWNDDYVKFTLTDITPHEKVEMVYWGPFNSTISETLGASVGVSQETRNSPSASRV